MNQPVRRGGRRGGAPSTREDILRAAREVFAEESYEGASLRRIARRAGVDPALLIHYFDSKEGLFSAAMALPFEPDDLAQAAFGPGMDGAGERLAAAFFAMWESEEYGQQLRGVVRAAVSDESAAERLRGFLQAEMLPLAGDYLPVDRSRYRMALAGSHLVGLAFARYILGVEPLASLPREDLVRWVGPVLQQYLAGDLASPADEED